MTTLIKLYETFLEKNSDSRVQHWRFMGGPGPTLFIISVYLCLVLVVLPNYMKNRKSYNITTIIRYYNIFQVAYCIWIIHMVLTSGWISGELNLGCQPVDYSNNPKALRMLNAFYYLYLIKMIELIETVFFILRKKYNQVTGLHVYHHASTLFLAYIGCKYVGGGMASMPVMVNSFIHVLMYSYYYVASYGPKWQKMLAPWKPKLTILQMIQFTFLILHALSALSPSCNVQKAFLLIYLPNVIVIFKMFYDFYQKSYKTKSKAVKMENINNGHSTAKIENTKNGRVKVH